MVYAFGAAGAPSFFSCKTKEHFINIINKQPDCKVHTKRAPSTYAAESLGRLTVAAHLPVANTHDVLVHGARNAVVVLGVQLGDGVH